MMKKKIVYGLRHTLIKFAWVIVCALIPGLSPAGDYEVLHEQGKSLYRSGNDPEAFEVYRQILDQYPGDADALLFRGRLYARMGQYDLAEKDLLQIIDKVPAYLDAYEALATVYFWDRNLERARNILTLWIQRDMENPAAYLLSARVAVSGRNEAAARTFLDEALHYGAGPDEVEALLRLINGPVSKTPWTAGVSYEYLIVDQDRPDWQQQQAYVSHDFTALLATLEFNRYDRNDTSDVGLVLDTYYKLWKKAYMNGRIQAGISGAFLPRADLTFEIFQAVGTRHEPAIGYRLMHFDSLLVHIPSIAWASYPGNWYVRDKISLIINETLSWQNQFTVRYLFENADNYLQFMNVLGTDFNVFNQEWNQSVSFALGGSVCLSEHIVAVSSLSWTRDEFLLNRIGGSLGLSYRW